MKQIIPEQFVQLVKDFGIEFDQGDVELLHQFLTILYEKNAVMNLTAIKTIDEAWVKHIFDSLTLLPYLIDCQANYVIDIGSGGGMPGIPLAITMPDTSFTLVESTKKKAVFINTVVNELDLQNVTVIGERAENLASPDGGFRNIADAVVARAVGSMSVLLELTIPFLRLGGYFFAIKGERAQEEIEESKMALRILGGKVESVNQTETGTIVSVCKNNATPKKYPRRPGEPKRMPLGSTK